MTSKPLYTISDKAKDSLAKIVEAITRLEFDTEFKRDTKLHRQNRLRSIHSSLAIEGNTLTLNEVTAIIEGRLVAGKQEEVKEVRNAYEAYDRIMAFDPYSITDFQKAHRLMTDGFVEESGTFRSRDVGYFDNGMAVYVGARPQFVPQLMADLFDWAKPSTLHPVLKSAIMHYEIETIHPFADGNGCMGRLWQTLLLASWNELFAWIPLEPVLYQNMPQYYKAIEEARRARDSGVFIEFMLSALCQIIAQQEARQVKHQVKHEVKHPAELGEVALAILSALKIAASSRKEIFAAIGLSSNSRAFKRHVAPLLEAGYIEMTIPDKPNSRLQKYRLTKEGRGAL